ncbi:MAG: AAA family ATPase [Pseudomonadota bacterium]
MATAKQDYRRFLHWLYEMQPVAPENVRRFASLVFADFDRVAQTAPQRNARATYLAVLARRNLATTVPQLPAAEAEVPQSGWPWQRLHGLSVGPFRGFAREETFDLRRRVVLIYGPNGAGKSSLCEAIERSLLGSIEEAGLKRLDEPGYLRNIHAQAFVEPRLTATDHERREIQVRANPDLFRFCFIEKNRIDSFSRIAQRPLGERAELIATLFGMDKFNDFCNRFNERIDDALVTVSHKQRELRLKREALARDMVNRDSEAARLAEHDATDEAYAQDFSVGITFARLREIIGTPEAPGRLAELDELLNANPATVIGLSAESVERAFELASTRALALRNSTEELGRQASMVSFRTLYGAVAELEEGRLHSCPACDTPLDQVLRNPFDKARQGLRDLRELADLQYRQTRQREELSDASAALRENLARLRSFLVSRGEGDSVVGTFLAQLPARPEGDAWWTGVLSRDAGQDNSPTPSLAQLLALTTEVESADAKARAQLEQRQELGRERADLLERRRHIDRRDLARQRIVDEAATARINIAAFDVANERLISEADQERQDMDRDAPIRAAYDAFLPMLRRFKNELPGLLIAGLGDLARDLYNEFNRADSEADKLASLYLPVTGEQRIELAFRGGLGQRWDALHVLSEGHIRCLGLAVLLAKAISIESPLLIFDDAVNAIDDDHRHGIKETIFAGDRLAQTQILMTCHSPEFIKDVKNSIPRDRRGDSQEYAITHHEGDHHPRVHRDVASSAYLDKARADFQRYQLRDALGHARRALEMLSNKAWKWLVFHNHGELRLALHGPSAPLNARDLCDAIRLKLRDTPAFEHPSKAALLDALNEILNASNLTWTYLNKGTHEEENRQEFDRVEVELVITRLERIDALQLRARN